MNKIIQVSLIIFIALGSFACSDGINSGSEQADLDFMEPMTAALISEEGQDIRGKGVFILSWRNFHPRFMQEATVRGTATAFGFEEETSLLPPHDHATTDMGTVRVESPASETVELRKTNSPLSGQKVYSSRVIGPFNGGSDLSFVSNGDFLFDVSGSQFFPSLELSISAPSELVTITTPSESSLDQLSVDLNLRWNSNTERPVGIFIRPAVQFNKGEKPQRPDHENSEMIILKDHDGSYTLSHDLLSKVASHSDENRVHISVGQLQFQDLKVEGETYRVITRTDDSLQIRLD